LATRIRLKRTGSRHQPHFRVVVVDQRKSRNGRTIEEIGYYSPSADPATINIDEDRALYWLRMGAQPTETVRSLLKKSGVMKSFQQMRTTQ